MQKYDDSKKTTTAKRLRQLRKDKGLSPKELEKKIETTYGIAISESTLKNYEIQNPSQERFKKGFGMRIEYLFILADFYGVSTDYLLGLTDIPDFDPNMGATCDYTGLSRDAVNAIMNFDKATDSYYYDTLGFKPPLLGIFNRLCEKGFITELVKAFGRCLYEVIIRKEIKLGIHSIEQEQSIMLPAIGGLNRDIENEVKRIVRPLIYEVENYYISGGNGYEESGNLRSVQPG